MYTKKQANYQITIGKRRCFHCKYYHPRSMTCDRVSGHIAANGTCDYFKRK